MNRESPSRTSSPVRSGRPESGRPLTNSDVSPSTASRVNSPPSTARMRQPRWPGDASSGEGMIRPWARTYAVPASTPLTATSSMAAHSSRSAGNGQPRACVHRDFKGMAASALWRVTLGARRQRLPVAGRPHVAPAAPRVFGARSIYRKSPALPATPGGTATCRPVETEVMERGNTVGVTVVAEDTPNERRDDRGLIWHRRAENQPRRDRRRPSNVPHDPSLHPSLACLSLEQWVCPGIWTDTGEDFRRISSVGVRGGAVRLSDRLVGEAVR